MSGDVLLFYHTHTPHSNQFERECRGLEITTHASDYIRILERLPANVDAVFVKTDHWRTDPTYFDQLEERLSERGQPMERFRSHVRFKIGGSSGTVINGVEGSVRSEQKHVVIAGLPLSDKGEYYNLGMEELIEAGDRGHWIAPAHIGMPLHRFERELLTEIFEQAKRRDVDVALGYPTGYFPLYNSICRNEGPFRTSVEDIANKHDIALLPELDLHGVVPEAFFGCGVLEERVSERLGNGSFPTGDLLKPELFRPNDCRLGITVRQYLRNYTAFIPFIDQPENPDERFRMSLPDEQTLQDIDIATQTLELRKQKK